MHPAPIKVNSRSELPPQVWLIQTLDSGELIYRTPTGAIYALQPAPVNTTCPRCRGTGGGQYNDCPACDGNGVI